MLLRDGTPPPTQAYEREGFDQAFHSFWHPRTGIGKKADGTLLLCDDNRSGSGGSTRRVKLPRFAELFLEWGATDALNLDGGSSSMLVIRDKVVSIKKKTSTSGKSPDELAPKKAGAARNTRTGRGNRRIRPMPRQQGRAISDAILIFSRF